MRTRAKLVKFTLAEERNFFALTCVLFDKLNFINFTLAFHKLYGVFGVKLISFKRKSLFDDFFHFFFYFFEIFGGERSFNIKVIIKSVVNSRANGQFRFGEQSFNSLRKNMRGSVAKATLCLVVIVKCEYFK